MKIECILAEANAVDRHLEKYVDVVKSYFGVTPKFRDLRVLPVEEFDAKYGSRLKMFGLVGGITTFYPNRDIFVREGSEASALHELVHAVISNDTISTFLDEGFAQLAAQEIAKLHGFKIPESYGEEVKTAASVVDRVFAEEPQSFLRRYAKAANKAKWLAREALKRHADAFKDEGDWGAQNLIEKKLVYELSHMIGVGPMLGQLFNPVFSESMCPVRDQLYGGMPEGGGYNSATEFEIGAQIIAEAIHCLLGSLGKQRDLQAMRHVERGHLREEIAKVRDAMEEYARTLYEHRMNREYSAEKVERSVQSIRRASPRLKELAQLNYSLLLKRALEDEEVDKAALACYKALEVLAEAMLKSVEGWPQRPITNPYRDGRLKLWTAALGVAVDKLIS